MRTKSIFCWLFILAFIFNLSGLYGQGERYDWSSYSSNNTYLWNDVVNWQVNGYSPGTPPGPNDSVYIDGTIADFTITGASNIEIAYFELSKNSSSGPFINFQFDSLTCNGDVRILGASSLQLLGGISKNTIIIDVDSGETSKLDLSGVVWHVSGDLVKRGKGELRLEDTLALDTASFFDGGNFYFNEGYFNADTFPVLIKKVIINDHNTKEHKLAIKNNFIITEVQSELDFTMLDSFSATSNDCKIIIRSKEEDVLDLNLGNWPYTSLQVDEMGVNLTHSGAHFGWLYLEVGESHSFHSADTTDLVIYNDFNLIGDDTLKYTLLRNAEIGDGFKIKIGNLASAQKPLNRLIIRNIDLYNYYTNSPYMLDVHESLGDGSCDGWNFINSPNPQAMNWAPTNSNRWSYSSNWEISQGVPAGRAPLPCDNVYFDNPGFAANDTVLIDELAYCRNMYWDDNFTTTNPKLVFEKDVLLLNGSMYLSPQLEIKSNSSQHSAIILFSDSLNNEIKTYGKTLPINLHITSFGSYILKDKLRLAHDKFIYFENGDFISDGYNITAGYMMDGGPDHSSDFPPVIDIRNSYIHLKGSTDLTSDNSNSSTPATPFMLGNDSTEILTTGSHIILNTPNLTFLGNGAHYDKVTSLADSTYFFSGASYNELNVKAGSFNGIIDSIVIKENLFIYDTASQKTRLKQAVVNFSNLGTMPFPTNNPKIINKSPNDICLDNVSIENVDVISLSPFSTENLIGSTSDTSMSSGWDFAPTKCYMDIYGTVMDTGLNPFTQGGHVVIFKLNPNSTAMFDTLNASLIDTAGNFLFTNLSHANYMIKANPKLSSGYMPAYCPDKIHWSKADTIHLISDTTGMTIKVQKPPSPPPAGSPGATITGKLDTTQKSPDPYLNILSDLRGPSDVFDSIVIGLIRPSGDLVMLDTTDNNGVFTFKNVQQGQYRLMPDIAGIQVDTTGLNDINIGTGLDTFNYLMEVDSNNIYVSDTSSGTLVSTNYLEQSDVRLKLWPNPVNNQLNIVSEEAIRDIRLYDQLMREIRPDVYSSGTKQYILNLSGIKRGIYHLRVNGKNVRARVLKL